MGNFDNIRKALIYIDDNLEEEISIEWLANYFHFSVYYFHRMFSVIVGKPLSAYIRDRRCMLAGIKLADTKKAIIDIAFDCGYNSAQSFSRAFRKYYGVSPREYRLQKRRPKIITVEEMIIKFNNRLQGGIYLNPKIIKRNKMIIAGTSGNGNKTYEVWMALEKLDKENPLTNKISENGYEIRINDKNEGTVYTGYLVKDVPSDKTYVSFILPACEYAVFDVFVTRGYESENNAMDEWLLTNEQGYRQKLLNNNSYCIEYYDERFSGNEDGSIVEIWLPIEKI